MNIKKKPKHADGLNIVLKTASFLIEANQEVIRELYRDFGIQKDNVVQEKFALFFFQKRNSFSDRFLQRK